MGRPVLLRHCNHHHLSATQWTNKLKAQQLPGCHAGTSSSTPPNPKFLYGVVLKRPPLAVFQYDIGGPQVTSSSPFFCSFHVPPFSPSQQFLNSLSFHISSSEGPLTPPLPAPPPTLLHTSKPHCCFQLALSTR